MSEDKKTKNLCTVPAADLADDQYFIVEENGELKRVPKAQAVLKELSNMTAADTSSLAGGGTVSAQTLLDAIADRVANKLLAKSQVVNNLLATVEGNPLDATQGKALKELLDTTNDKVTQLYSESEKTNNALGNIRQTLVDDCNNPKSLMGFIDRSTLNTPYSEGITSAVNGLLFSVSPNQAIWNGQMILGNSQNPDIFFRGSNGVGSGFSKWGILAKKSDLGLKKVLRLAFEYDQNGTDRCILGFHISNTESYFLDIKNTGIEWKHNVNGVITTIWSK